MVYHKQPLVSPNYSRTTCLFVDDKKVLAYMIRKQEKPHWQSIYVHARTRKCDLIETLFDLGLSISYGRVMDMSTTIDNDVCEQYHRNQVVCSPNLRENSSHDHTPSSTTATDALHGTGISLFQHPTIQVHDECEHREHRILA